MRCKEKEYLRKWKTIDKKLDKHIGHAVLSALIVFALITMIFTYGAEQLRFIQDIVIFYAGMLCGVCALGIMYNIEKAIKIWKDKVKMEE